jgi:putative ABC transport system permease protein
MVIRKLALSNLLVHRARSLLTIAAIALSVSLVVSVTSGYSSVEAMAYRFAGRYMGSADAVLTRRGISSNLFPESIVDSIRKDPDVKRITGRLEVDNVTTDAAGDAVGQIRKQHLIGIRRPLDNRIENLDPKVGKWFESPDGNVAVIDQVAAELSKATVGDTFKLTGPHGSLDLKVLGIVQKPQVLAAHIQSIYLPLETLQAFVNPGKPPLVDRAMIDLKSGASQTAFMARWTPRLTTIDSALTLRLGRDVRQVVDNNLQVVHLMSYLGGSVSMLAATFIIFSALSMGVTERSRTLAMMRAIGALRGQVAKVVVLEGLVLSGIGVLVGTPMGWLWLYFIQLKFNHLLPTGFTISWGGVLFAGLGSLLAALLASLLPAWWATRVRPLEAMSPSATPPSTRTPYVAAVFGLLLIAVDPAILFVHWDQLLHGDATTYLPRERQLILLGHFVLGLPTLMLGFFLLAPLFVVVLENLAGPVVAIALRMKFALLRQQLSGGVWRAAGTCAALMVGLSILIAMETQGHSLLASWELPDKFPDVFIVSWGTGLNDKEIDQLAHMKGIKPGDLLPIAVAAPESPFGNKSGLTALGMAAIIPDATMFLGVDPDKGMRMMQLKFIQGNSTDAARLLNQGQHVIVTDEFRQLRHLNLGDPVNLSTDHGTVPFIIAGVVSSPGIDVINAKFDMGQQFDQRTAGSIFGSIADARKYFGADVIHLFAANLDADADKDQVLKEVQQQLGQRDMQAGDVRQIKQSMESTFSELLLVVAIIPLAAMGVASLGVTNTIMASIRSRRWQLGVLRSIGLTRSQLVRLVFGEALLVGVVASGLGLAAGAVMATDARQVGLLLTGNHAPMLIPWDYVLLGVSLVLSVSVLAGAWPAINVAKSEPLFLLQGGRSMS